MARYQMTIISAPSSLDARRRVPNHFFLSIVPEKIYHKCTNVDFEIMKTKTMKLFSLITIVHIGNLEMTQQ